MKRIEPEIVISLLAILLIVFIIIFDVVVENCDRRDMVVTVTDKQVKTSSDHGKYLVYCKDSDGNIEVLEIEDSFVQMRFDSSDEYAAIEIGKTYKFTVVGKRMYFLSKYPNILNHELEEEQ